MPQRSRKKASPDGGSGLTSFSMHVVEDSATSSMAGQFESIIGINGYREFADAVTTVLDSRVRAGASDHPIGVLVQPLLEPAYGIAPGQAVVMYDGTRVVGSATIASTVRA